MPFRPLFPSVIDSSMLSAWRSCQKKFHYEYVQHLKPKGAHSVHLHAGAAYAHGLEQARTAFYVDGKPVREAESIGLDALSVAYGNFECPKDSAKSLDRMMGAMEFYFDNYPLDQDAARPATLPGDRLGIEFSFAEPLPIPHPVSGEPLIFSGRSDMIVDFAGSLYIEDDKTTSSLGPSWAKQWEMRGQFTGYCWAAQQIGLPKPIAGCLIRGISILKTKYETQQALTYRSQMEIDRWYDQTLRDIRAMLVAWESGQWDYNLDESCNHYGGCPFRDACKSNDPEPWLASQFEQRVWDPLAREDLPLDLYIAKHSE